MLTRALSSRMVLISRSPPSHSQSSSSLPHSPSMIILANSTKEERSPSQAPMVYPPESLLSTSIGLSSGSSSLSRFHLVDSELDKVEDMSVVMRVTLDRIAENNEREDSESVLAQIVQTKKAILSEANCIK